MLSSDEIMITNKRISSSLTDSDTFVFLMEATERLKASAEHESDFLQSLLIFVFARNQACAPVTIS